MIITFCGHSTYSGNLEDERRLLKLLEVVAQNKQVDFYLGGYGNFDKFALKCAKIYKQQNNNAKLIFITPYLDQWLNRRNDTLIKDYDEIIYPEIEHVPKKFAILKRNEWIINKANFVFAYVKTHYGGAYKTLLFAHKQKKPFINLYQGDYELY
ncbi:MAG: hypothetical protein IKW33_03915 [Clostridia bacterium]|nr:hypothetical protein [Clostridia bacterium]